MDAAEQRALIERYLACYNAFDIPGMLSVLSPDVFFENFSGGELTAATQGKSEFAALAERSKAVFSEREQRITSYEATDAGVRVGIAYRGVLALDLPDGPRAGSVLEMTGSSEFVFDDAWINSIVDRS